MYGDGIRLFSVTLKALPTWSFFSNFAWLLFMQTKQNSVKLTCRKIIVTLLIQYHYKSLGERTV